MKSSRVRKSAVAVALLSPLAALAEQLDTVFVIGTRASLESAIERKRVSDDIIDSVVAAEIHKLADLSVADAVQRITGVQIARDRGEASIASVRGLVQIETTLNGREIFTAGFGRAFSFLELMIVLAIIGVLLTVAGLSVGYLMTSQASPSPSMSGLRPRGATSPS